MNKNNMYDTFDDESFEYDYPISFEERNKEYLQDKEKPYKTITQGDPFDVTFSISSELIIEGRYVVLTIYNFRYEPLYQVENRDLSTTVTFSIPDAASSILFPEGVFPMGVTLYDPYGELGEIVKAKECSLLVE